jgi:hypothetical protein
MNNMATAWTLISRGMKHGWLIFSFKRNVGITEV